MAEKALSFMEKNALKEGDLVEISEKRGSPMKGTIIPSAGQELLALKLENGYNVGISIEKIFSVKKLGEGKAVGKAKPAEAKKKPGLPQISILHTGGTIASRVDYRTGGVYAAFGAEDLLTMFPELGEIANFGSRLVSNMMSEDMRFSNYREIAKAVSEEIKKGARGVIIGHGTDTLAVTSAALAFMLENCPVPVLLVGAQRSSDRGSSDAGMNLICAARFIAKTDFAGVAICMHQGQGDGNCAILPACKTRKMHTSRRDAFKAVNGTPIAIVSYKDAKIEFLKKGYERRGEGKKLVLKDKFEEKVGLLKTHVNMHPEEFEFFQKNGYKGFVFETTGIGQAPTNTNENLANYESLKKFIEKGGLVALTSQCIFGRVHPTIYKNCRRLSDIGVVFCEDMLTETAFVKLAWLLGNYPREEAKRLIAKNLRGEISERTEISEPADLNEE
jgi:glutamyl-tRNA(Gln) amidotransferase subunit D